MKIEVPGQKETPTNTIYNDEPTSALVECALAYVTGFGWPVFPCTPGLKTPMTAHGFKDATTDVQKVEAWWRRTPDANIATPTGGQFDVLDVEMRHLDEFLKWFGNPTRFPCVRTPSGGLHVYVGATGKRCQRAWFGDFKGQGGYVLLPPSEVKGSLYGDYKGLE